MNRRGFFRDMLLSFAATTALARTVIELVDDGNGWVPEFYVNVNGEEYGARWAGNSSIELDRPITWEEV